ncbi:MAG: 2,5-diketo-D-gluconic acid reductase [Tenericutes bacterium GWC2_34_14]|nr:MAG: 2,5-diketo-D-gluconic acid reductase [Tenericutes bacterium GWA2_35_7]OHE28972.1 MAG: 2,5-diketo-D-gluconic acid reductase [Tenericutes bacterium GWC2_34_14]OHE33886.1 MAG: 2,5-diketo-D-gluconic acid reductase [Tenericutes bacterium GWE2_34_108]OHE36621.1 MAG: 2,5-diketo-D-gluconic acid reductase [Tenericutes bacterium GWF1_35_14]OHE37872.1 MAG: 2,5-diketo-D-gluconic acid reductase [Tenericutes bacterium GWF2_35_184]OHE45326.1 MAG: 2,5-diketo-D-gluconic acid reductase [Tenericutes bact
MMKTIQDVYVLKNGVKMPKVGFGTWQIPDGEACYNSVSLALKHGYRHIDTAAAYRNEASVGRAIKDSGIPRDHVFVTSKLQSHIKSYQETLDAFEKTLKELDMDYLDLYLIHAPWPWNEIGKDCDAGNVEAFKAMEKLYLDGKVRSIGVSNFSPKDLDNILKHCEIIPHVNQIAFFIGNNQEETKNYCDAKGILVEAYSPLAIGYALSNDIIINMAKTYKVTPAQLCIRYCIEKGTAPLPKSTHESRIIENTGLDFKMKEEDVKFLDTIKDDPRRWN